MRCDNLDVIGFINMQDRACCCYEPGSRRELPREYSSKILGPARLGKTFMAEAVRELSRFTDRGPSEEAKRSLVGLKIMVCDSAMAERDGTYRATEQLRQPELVESNIRSTAGLEGK